MSCVQSIRWWLIICLLFCGREPASARAILENRDSFVVSYAFVGNEKDLSLDLIQESPPQFSDDYLGFVDGPNLYAYVKQNPWTSFDPLGLYETGTYLGDSGQAALGCGDSLWGSVKGIAQFSIPGWICCPKQNFNTVFNVYSHPVKTLVSAADKVADDWKNGGVRGQGRAVMDVAQVVLGAAEGVSAVKQIAKSGTKVASELVPKTPDLVAPKPVPSTSPTASAVDTGALHLPGYLPDGAPVIRGGQCLPENWLGGNGVTIDSNGLMNGASVQSSGYKSASELAASVPHPQVGQTTVGAVRAAGGDVIPSPNPRNPDHATLSGLSPDDASMVTRPTNKYPK